MSSTYNPLAWQRQGQLHDSESDTNAVSGLGRSRAEGLIDSLCTSTVNRPVSAQHPAQPLQAPSNRETLPVHDGFAGAGRQEGILSGVLQFPPPAATAPSAPPGFEAAPSLQLPAAISRNTTRSYLPPHLRARPPQRPDAAQVPEQAQPAVPTAAVPSLNLPALQMPNKQPMTSSVLHAAQQSQLQDLLSLLGSAPAAGAPTPAAPSSSNADQFVTVAAAAAASTAAPPGFDLPALRLGPTATDPAPAAAAVDPAVEASVAAKPPSPKPPPPGSGTTIPAAAAAPTAVIQQSDRPGATAATDLGLTASAAAAEEEVMPNILATHASRPPAAAAAAAPAGSTAAAGSSSAAAAAAQVVAPTWAAAVSSTPPPAAASAGAPVMLPPPQQQQQQQYAPQQPRPSLSVMLDCLTRELDSGPGSCGVNFSLREGLKWLQGYDPAAGGLVDRQMKEYLEFISKDQGPAVLSCAVFFAMGHHGAFRGDLPMLTLYSADHPAKVLNKRVSYYRTLFSQNNRKVELLAALVAHRPDAASHLTHRSVQRLFSSSTDTAAAAAVTAGLLLLPEGWEEVCADPYQYVKNYVAAVLQDTSNADKMMAHLDRKIQEAAAADDDDDGESSSSSAVTAAVQEADPDPGQPQPQPAARTAWSRSSSASSSTADISRAAAAAAAAVTAAQQQQLPVRSAWGSSSSSSGGADTHSAGVQQRQQHLLQEQSNSNHSSRHPSPGAAKTAVATAAAAGDRSDLTTAVDNPSSSSSNKSDLIELALKQLQMDRPDVMMFTTRDLRDRIKTLDPQAAVAAVGELMILPKGWEARFAKVGKPRPMEYLSSIVSRAAAHTAAAAAGSNSSTADGDGWVTLDQRSNAQVNASSNSNAIVSSTDNSSSAKAMRSSSSSSNGISKGMNVSAAWRQLEADRPWLMKYLKDKHRAEIRFEHGKALTASQQVQVLSVLNCVNPGTVINAKEADATLMNIIRKAKALVLQPTPQPLQDALDALTHKHPQVMQYFDAGMFSTLHNLAMRDVGKAIAALEELQAMNFPKDLKPKYKNPSGFFMAMIAKHAK